MTASDALQKQCDEQRERCVYTATTLFVWVRALRLIRILFVILPIICGAFAGWDLLKVTPEYATVTALLALAAGLVPAVYAALKLDEHLPTAARLSGEYKNLEIIFADLGKIGPHKQFDVFEKEYNDARSRLEKANGEAYTAPEWCFKSAQRKIKQGHYTFGEGEVAPSAKAS